MPKTNNQTTRGTINRLHLDIQRLDTQHAAIAQLAAFKTRLAKRLAAQVK